MISFEWDEAKNLVNIDKHGVSFSEAKSVFYDENAIQYFDDGHSEDEDRFLMLGLSNHLRMLLVVHSFRGEDSVIRIISARKATKKESMRYGV